MQANNIGQKILMFLRFIVALIFIISGGEKLLSPVGNFIYVVESYQLVPDPFLVKVIAYVFPWIEFFIGIFLILGLWIRPVLMMVIAVSSGFIMFVGQALVRGLPLSNCGCFGDLVHIPVWATFVLDWFLLISAILLYRYTSHIKPFSLDRLFE